MLNQSAHIDTFARDNLPPIDQWPEFKLEGFDYPEKLNAGFELTDAMVAKGFGDFTALIGNGRRRTYKELTDWSMCWLTSMASSRETVFLSDRAIILRW